MLKEIKTSTGLIIIFAAAVLFVGGALIYWYYPNGHGGSNIASEAIINETADWKTYTNTDYGFSFKYPKEEVITTYEQASALSPLLRVDVVLSTPEYRPTDLVISVYKTYKELDAKQLGVSSLKDFLDKYSGSGDKTYSAFTADTFAGKEGYKAVLNKETININSGYSYFVELDNGIVIDFHDYDRDNQVAKIKKSFIFFAATPIADHKFYLNDTCGFSFEYPKDWTLSGRIDGDGNIDLADTKKSYGYALSVQSPIQIDCEKDSYNGDIDKYWSSATGGATGVDKTITSIGGKTAYFYHGTRDGKKDGIKYNEQIVFNDDHIIIFYNNYDDIKEQDPSGDINEAYNSIISSVKFTK